MARAILIYEWEKLASISHYDVRELAKLCQLSVRQLERDFRRQYACTPRNWLNEQRLKIAGQLLLSGRSIKVVASELGFKQTSHFCRHFKLRHKQTPTQFLVLNTAQNSCRPQITDVVGR